MANRCFHRVGRSLGERIFLFLLPLIALTLALIWLSGQPTAQAMPSEPQAFPPWSFKPLASALPASMVSPSVFEMGEQNELLVSHFTSPVHTVSLVIGGVATPILKVGDAAPGGGVFAECCGFGAYVASPTLIYLAAPVDESGTTVTRFFRWSNSILEPMPVPAGVEYDLAVNDAHGRFLAKRVNQGASTTEYWITDGFLFNSTPITLQELAPNTNTGTAQRLMGITADGGFLVHEAITSGTFECSRRSATPGQPDGVADQTTATRLFWMGGRSGTIASGTHTSDGCVGNGLTIHQAVLNSAGDVFSQESTEASAAGEFTSFVTRLWLYPADGGGTELVAQGEQVNGGGPYFFLIPLAVTKARQPIFVAATAPQGFPEGLFSGPAPATDAFDGDFVQGFGQDGTAERLFQFSENGGVLVQARLADNSTVNALGRTGTLEWANASGGNWGDAANWDPVQVPGQGDESVFRLAASYDVNVGSRTSGRSSVEAGSVAFQSADLTLIGPFSVGGAANFSLPAGKMTANDLIVGHLPPTNPATPPTARVHIANSGTVFTATAQTLIGQAGVGDLFINDGRLNSGEVQLGSGFPGTAVVGGVNAQWFATSLNVGAGATATLTIENGGQMVVSNAAVIGQAAGLQSFPALLSVDNGGAASPPLGNFRVNQLTIGDALPGTVDIQNGGAVLVVGLMQVGLQAHNTPLGDGRIIVEGTDGAGQQASLLSAFEDALLGMGNGARGDWQIFGGGKGTVLGNLHLGHEAGSRGTLSVSGFSANGLRSQLNVGTDGGTELCRVGFDGQGSATVLGGGLLSCSNMNIGGNAGSRGDVLISGQSAGGTPSALHVDRVLCVGGATLCGSGNGVTGTLTLSGGAIQADILAVGLEGHILGQGSVTVRDSFIFGEVAPGLGLPVRRLGAASPASLTITGSVEMSSTASLVLDVHGVGNHDRLIVVGPAKVGGKLVLNFGQGFAPKQGDLFTFVQAGTATGSFAQVVITGLDPGFEKNVTVANGVVTLTALNDGVATTEKSAADLFLPLLVRGW